MNKIYFKGKLIKLDSNESEIGTVIETLNDGTTSIIEYKLPNGLFLNEAKRYIEEYKIKSSYGKDINRLTWKDKVKNFVKYFKA